jgi:hypothetical protein
MSVNINHEGSGKQALYSDISELASIIRDWFIEMRKFNESISIVKLSIRLGVSRGTFYNYKEYSPEYKALIQITQDCVEEFWVEKLGTSETAARFILASTGNYTVIEKQIIESDTFEINIKKPKA